VSLKDTRTPEAVSNLLWLAEIVDLPMCLYWKQLDEDCCLVQSPDTSPREKSVTATSTE